MNTKILSIFLLTTLLGACSTLAWATTLPESGILMHEESTSEREVKALKPVLPTNPDHPPSADAPQEERLIDDMDVYSLSPHATRLALPRMMAPHFVALLQQGRVHLPPPAEWQAIIQRAAARHNLPENLVAAVIRTESNFQVDAVSNKGAQGLMQLMPETQRYLGVTNPYDPEANVLAGCAYLREQLTRFGSVELALAAYNAGPGNVQKYGGIPPFKETQNFVTKVLGHTLSTPESTPKAE